MKTTLLVLAILGIGLFSGVISGQALRPDQIQNGYRINDIQITTELSINQQSQYRLEINLTTLAVDAFDNFAIEIKLRLSNVTAALGSHQAATRVVYQNDHSIIEITPSNKLAINNSDRLVVIGWFDADYITVEDGNLQFLLDWDLNIDAANVSVIVILPKFAAIHRDSGGTNLFPNTRNFGSTGEEIVITWNGLSNIGELNTQIFVQFEVYGYANQSPTWTSLTTIFLILFLLSLLMTGVSWYYWQHQRQPIDDQKTRVITSIKPVILTPQEQEILDIIAEHEGGILQSDLVDLLNFSRARVSQYLSSFEERGLITKHKAGRQNYITLAAEMVLEKREN